MEYKGYPISSVEAEILLDILNEIKGLREDVIAFVRPVDLPIQEEMVPPQVTGEVAEVKPDHPEPTAMAPAPRKKPGPKSGRTKSKTIKKDGVK